MKTKTKGYRLSIDDVILCFYDIYKHPEYTSIFDNDYLAMFKDIHEKHGTKIHLNIYYETDDKQFNLTMMPDRFKNEWIENSDWLRLSFHANSDKPNWPYRGLGYDAVKNDCEKVQKEIIRFAGVLHNVTTLHFADTTKEGVKALRDCGIKVLQGDFVLKDGQPYISYYLNKEQFDNVRYNVFWKDEETDMIFYACDVVLNTKTLESIPERMDEFQNMYPNRDFVDILIHEQYYHTSYKVFLPDYRKRIEKGIEWCEQNGYSPAWVEDMIDF